jgi:hypothetical protein
LSNRIRIERENCCDDLAVRMCGDRKLYAEALLRLERERVAGSALAVAATGTGTIKRIQRILGLESSGADWQAAVVALVFVVVWISAGLLQPATLDAREIAIAPPRAPEPIARVVAPAASSPLEAIAAIITAQQAPTAPAASVSVESQAPSPQFLPLGVIEGQLRHINGNPAAGIRVAFMPLDPGLGASALAKTVLTDRNGRYRLPDVEPGRYWIAAGLSELRTYYPGVTVESDPNISIDRLQFVTVASGQTVSNIDFTVAPVSLATKPPNGPAAGIMMMDDGSPLPAIRLGQRFGGPDGELLKDASESYLALLLEVNGQPVGLSQPEALRGANIASISYWIRGVFQKRENVVTIPQLPSGYYVKSMTYGDVDLTKAPLIVRNSDVIEIVLTKTRPASLPPGVRLSGRITDRSFGSKTDLRLVLTPVTNVSPAPIGQAPVTTVLANSDDGSFEINGVLPGRYTLAPFGYRQNQMAAPLDVRLLQLAPVLPGVTFEVGAVDVTNLELKFEP